MSFTGPSTAFQVVRSPALLITSSLSSPSVQAGSSASANLTLTSILGYGFAGKGQQLNNYDFPVTLACSNLPPHASCTFRYPSPDPNIANAVDIPCTGTTAAADDCSPGLASVTINTNVSVGTASQRGTIAFGALFGFGLIGLCFRRKPAEKGRVLLMVCMMILSGAFGGSLTGCSTQNLSPASVDNACRSIPSYNRRAASRQPGDHASNRSGHHLRQSESGFSAVHNQRNRAIAGEIAVFAYFRG